MYATWRGTQVPHCCLQRAHFGNDMTRCWHCARLWLVRTETVAKRMTVHLPPLIFCLAAITCYAQWIIVSTSPTACLSHGAWAPSTNLLLDWHPTEADGMAVWAAQNFLQSGAWATFAAWTDPRYQLGFASCFSKEVAQFNAAQLGVAGARQTSNVAVLPIFRGHVVRFGIAWL